MVAEEVRAGRMTEEQAENHPSRNIISRALGAEPTVEIDIKTIMVEPGTSFLICSDGITRHVGDQEIKGVLTFGGDPVDICEYLKGLCYERGAEDNLTAVIVKVSGTPSATSKPPPVFELIDEDEPTIATARSPFESVVDDNEPDVLELATREVFIPPEIHEIAESEMKNIEPPAEPGLEIATDAGPDIETERTTEPELVQQVNGVNEETIRSDAFSMFGDSSEASADSAKPSMLGKIAAAIGLMLFGALIGVVVYQSVLAPKPVSTSSPQFSEMKSANIPLSAFEENRRSVDLDPAAYVAKFASSPQDCEDYYLLGRAYLLSGDYIKARGTFTESRNRLAEADPVNSKILASDIAMALAVTNDTTIQSILKKELDGAKPSLAANTNANTTPTR